MSKFRHSFVNKSYSPVAAEAASNFSKIGAAGLGAAGKNELAAQGFLAPAHASKLESVQALGAPSPYRKGIYSALSPTIAGLSVRGAAVARTPQTTSFDPQKSLKQALSTTYQSSAEELDAVTEALNRRRLRTAESDDEWATRLSADLAAFRD